MIFASNDEAADGALRAVVVQRHVGMLEKERRAGPALRHVSDRSLEVADLEDRVDAVFLRSRCMPERDSDPGRKLAGPKRLREATGSGSSR